MTPATQTTMGLPAGGKADVVPPGAEANARGFYLHDGDTVVFYGDSITEQNYYNQWVELYAATRFPWMRVHFYGAGVGGDRVTGGGGGPIDQRLARDVFSEKPTVVTVMLGMNDGGYRVHDRCDRADLRKGIRASARFDSRACAGCADDAAGAFAVRRCDASGDFSGRIQRGDATLLGCRSVAGGQVWRVVRESKFAGGDGDPESRRDGPEARGAPAAGPCASRSAGALGDGRSATEGVACSGARLGCDSGRTCRDDNAGPQRGGEPCGPDRRRSEVDRMGKCASAAFDAEQCNHSAAPGPDRHRATTRIRRRCG